jgi:hypothetical protein
MPYRGVPFYGASAATGVLLWAQSASEVGGGFAVKSSSASNSRFAFVGGLQTLMAIASIRLVSA